MSPTCATYPSASKWKISAINNACDEARETLDRAIAEAFGFEVPEEGSQGEAIMKHADDLALLVEAARLLPDGGEALRRDRGFGDEAFRDLAPLEEPLPPVQA
jgi:hypothetical protein